MSLQPTFSLNLGIGKTLRKAAPPWKTPCSPWAPWSPLHFLYHKTVCNGIPPKEHRPRNTRRLDQQLGFARIKTSASSHITWDLLETPSVPTARDLNQSLPFHKPISNSLTSFKKHRPLPSHEPQPTSKMGMAISALQLVCKDCDTENCLINCKARDLEKCARYYPEPFRCDIRPHAQFLFLDLNLVSQRPAS